MCKSTNCLLVSLTLAITILVITFGCGRRTTALSRTDFKSDTLNYNTSIELRQNSTFNDIGTVRPSDPSKPMLWGGAWHYNTVIQFDKTISSGLDIQSGESLSYQGEEQSGETHSTDRKNSGHIYLILSAVIGTLFVLYLTLKKYIP